MLLGKIEKARGLRRPKAFTLNVRYRDSRIRFKEAQKNCRWQEWGEKVDKKRELPWPQTTKISTPAERQYHCIVQHLFPTCCPYGSSALPTGPQTEGTCKQGHSHLSIGIKKSNKEEANKVIFCGFTVSDETARLLIGAVTKTNHANYLPGTCFAYIHSWSGKVLS
jgi:hypothetical protein